MYGHPHQKRFLAARMLSFAIPKDVSHKPGMILDPLIPTTNATEGQNVEGVLLQLIHQSHPLKKNGGARKSGSGVQERTALVITNQAGKVDIMTTAKITRGTTDGAALPVHHSDQGRRARAWIRLPRALRKSLMITNGLKNPALVSSWDPLPFRQCPLLQRLRALMR